MNSTQLRPEVVAPASELVIDIYPRGYVGYSGTASQLIDEGIIPEDFQWPDANKSWTDGPFDYWMVRHSHKGMTRAQRKAAGPCDYFYVQIALAANRGTAFARAHIHAAEEELKQAIRCRGIDWRIAHTRTVEARQDDKFQTLLSAIGAKQPKRTRHQKTSKV